MAVCHVNFQSLFVTGTPSLHLAFLRKKYVTRCGWVWNLKCVIRSGLYANFGVKMNAPRITGVWNTTFQNALQSTSRIRLRHQSGPPPCSAPKTSVPALFAEALSGPLTLADPVAASASAARTAPAKSQSFRRCIYPSLSGLDLGARAWDDACQIEAHYANGDSRTRERLARITSSNQSIRRRACAKTS